MLKSIVIALVVNPMLYSSDLNKDLNASIGNKNIRPIPLKNLIDIEVADLEKIEVRNGFVSPITEPLLGDIATREMKNTLRPQNNSEAFYEFKAKMEMLTYEQTQRKLTNLYTSSEYWESTGIAIANLGYILAIAAPICAFFEPIFQKAAFVSGTLGVVAVGLSRISKQAQVRRNENQKVIKDILDHLQIGTYIPQPVNIEGVEDNAEDNRKEDKQ